MKFIKSTLLYLILMLAALPMGAMDTSPSKANSQECIPDPMTIEGYKNTPETVKIFLRANARKIRHTDKNDCVWQHTLSSPDYLEELRKIALELRESFPKATICGLGQSPAYIIEALQRLDEIDGIKEQRAHRIAFSGRWFTSDGCLFNPLEEKPNTKQTTAYRKYLEKNGFDLAKIVERHQKTETKTIVIDYVQSGAALYSFLDVLFAWAEEYDLLEELQSAVQAHIFTLYSPLPEQYNDLASLGFKVTVHPVTRKNTSRLIYCMCNSDSWYDDRLVPSFKYTQWNKVDPAKFKPSFNADLLRFMVLDHVMQAHEKEKSNKTAQTAQTTLSDNQN